MTMRVGRLGYRIVSDRSVRAYTEMPSTFAYLREQQLASPCLVCDIPQTYLEPILVKNATARGTRTRFSTEYLSHTQDDDGVTTTVRDRLTGAVYNIRSKYLIGADGARSKVAEDIGLPTRARWTSRAR